MNNLTITEEGKKLSSRLFDETTTARFTRIVTSDYDYSKISDLSSVLDIESVKQEVTISEVRRVNDTTVTIRATVDNKNLSKSYYVKTVGLYAKDAQEQEILFGISLADQPEPMPTFNNTQPSAIIFTMSVIVGNSAQVLVELNPTGTATIQDVIDLEEEVEQLNISVKKIYRDIIVTVPTSWTGSTAPYTQELNVPGIKVGDPAEMWSAVDETTAAADAKLWNKMASMIDCAQINADGNLTLICKSKKPTSEFKIRLKGVSGS